MVPPSVPMDQVAGQLVLADRFLSSSPSNGLSLEMTLKLIACEQPTWSPLILQEGVTAYSTLITLPAETSTGRVEIPLHLAVGKISRGMPSVEAYPYGPGESEKQRRGRARNQGLLDPRYKLVIVEDQELRGVYAYAREIETLFLDIDARHNLRNRIASTQGLERTAAALELYLRGK